MNQKMKEDMPELFSEAFHQAVPPMLENLATKTDIVRIEKKLESHEGRMDRHGQLLEDHEKRSKTSKLHKRS